jgi:hypothetical protein
MTQDLQQQADSATAPAIEGAMSRGARFRQGLGRLRRAGLVFLLMAAAGLPATLVSVLLAYIPRAIAEQAGFSPDMSALFDQGIRSGVAMLLFFTVAIVIPGLWTRVSNPSSLRALAYLGIQLIAVSLGVLVPDRVYGTVLTWALASAGSGLWLIWQQRWRGSGVAPSIFAGFLRPEVHPGQIWFAFITGEHETKLRPVMVLNPDPEHPSKWLVAYFTTQQPKAEYLKPFYLEVPSGGLRGLTRDNWISLKDMRTLARRKFRLYNGLAPHWAYKTTCIAHGIEPNPLAWTVDETIAGAGAPPLSEALSRARLMRSEGHSLGAIGWDAISALLRMHVPFPIRVRSLWRR